jgi:hypothetical protein
LIIGALVLPQTSAGTGGFSEPVETATLKGQTASVLNAPPSIRRAVKAANRISDEPYRFGGGHGSFTSSGYDCSGSVSYVLHAAGFLKQPRTSGGLMTWGERGRGEYLTVYANGGHAYAVIAGLRFDTSGGAGPRWHSTQRSRLGYRARHAKGL